MGHHRGRPLFYVLVATFGVLIADAIYSLPAKPEKLVLPVAQAAVLDKIATPATAVFGEPTIKEGKSGLAGKRVFLIESYVDAQNGFGALVRTKWAAGVTLDGEKAELVDVIFNPDDYSVPASRAFSNVAR